MQAVNKEEIMAKVVITYLQILSKYLFKTNDCSGM